MVRVVGLLIIIIIVVIVVMNNRKTTTRCCFPCFETALTSLVPVRVTPLVAVWMYCATDFLLPLQVSGFFQVALLHCCPACLKPIHSVLHLLEAAHLGPEQHALVFLVLQRLLRA